MWWIVIRSWWTGKGLVAVVTGGNKGIGLELCRLFAKHGLIVVLSARSIERGLNALNHLKQQLIQEESKDREDEGNLYFHQLDITDPLSISRFSAWIESTFGGLDILVNILPPSVPSLSAQLIDNLSTPLVKLFIWI